MNLMPQAKVNPMTDQHPITPHRELIEQWASEKVYDERDWLYEFHIAHQAARWAADQELLACCEWLRNDGLFETRISHLRAARRPKPPSLKELALEALKHAEEGWRPVPADCDTIRRALEQLDD
jgi:hypothetical protein